MFYNIADRVSQHVCSKINMAMRSKDLSDCVVTALEIAKLDKDLTYKHGEKSASKSLQHGALGKRAYCEGNYDQALLEYNLALLEAPHKSDVMIAAYYNRAELLLQTKNFSACVRDIEICLALDCPDKMVNELKKMKDKAFPYLWIEQKKSSVSDQFFKLKGKLNPDIPCASSDIEVIMESQRPKVVAARDIPVGTVLALETSFVSTSNIEHNFTQCHYCLKLSLNLMPCDGCLAAFCDENCKEQSMREGHNVECKIKELLLIENSSRQLAVLATLKLRQICKSWDELITASHKLGDERMRNSSIADIFGSNKFSVLNSHDDKHFIHGAMFYSSFYFAYIIHVLDIETSFFPSSPEEKSAAIRAISRIMMHLSLYSTPVLLQQCTKVITRNEIIIEHIMDRGCFPFISKLSRSCLPNVYVAGMGNAAALVTCMPIKQGAEITIPYTGNSFVIDNKKRALQILDHYKVICNCIICSGSEILYKQLDDTQMKVFQKFKANEIVKKPFEEINLTYKKTCETLELLSDAPYSKEYGEVFEMFLLCLMHWLHSQFPNKRM